MGLIAQARGLLRQKSLVYKAWEHAKAGTLNRRLVLPLRKRAYRLRERAFRLRLDALDRMLGAQASNSVFWKNPRAPGWSAVDARLRHLHDTAPQDIAHFTKVGFSITRDPQVILNLSRSALTKDTMRECLQAEPLEKGSSLGQRMYGSQMTCAAFIAAAALLLPEKESAAFAKQATAFVPDYTRLFRRMIDSCGVSVAKKPKNDARRFLPHSGFRAARKKRLIIVQSVADIPTLPLLFQGAGAATVFAMDDLYGRADFADALYHAGPCHVDVEHCRSRITRFSPDYHRVHEDTRSVAETLVADLGKAGWDTATRGDPNGTAMALADHLFFPCLQFVALEQLVASDEFDHVVVALGCKTTANKRFVRLLSGLRGLATDPRVELVCLSPDNATLETLDVLAKVLVTPPVLAPLAESDAAPVAPDLTALQEASDLVAATFGDWPDTPDPRVMLATAQVAAYNRSSAAYIQTIAKIANLRVAFLGSNLMAFANVLDDTLASDVVTVLPQRPHHTLAPLQRDLGIFLHARLPLLTQGYVAHVIAGRIGDVARNGIMSYLAHAHLCSAWFARLKQADQLPQAVVLTPFRSIRVAALTEVARAYNVPSIAIEPHGLNASYCRYCQVSADYYGVTTRFFAQEAVAGFGMQLERCPVIGSPRLQGPASYDVEAATALTRARLKVDGGIDLEQGLPVFAYFTQPSDWSQISAVWRIILEATEGVDCVLVLKTHPEETASRINAYLAIAQEMGAMGRVVRVDTDAVSLIEASDLILSGYSATVVEAALYQKPVFCVTNGKVEYPLNQHDVIGGPLFRTAGALRREIGSFLKDATPYHETAAAFLQREPQLVEGFEGPLSALLQQVIALPPEQSIRPDAQRPASLFLEGPHTVYEV